MNEIMGERPDVERIGYREAINVLWKITTKMMRLPKWKHLTMIIQS